MWHGANWEGFIRTPCPTYVVVGGPKKCFDASRPENSERANHLHGPASNGGAVFFSAAMTQKRPVVAFDPGPGWMSALGQSATQDRTI
jgi:hypothetical protein